MLHRITQIIPQGGYRLKLVFSDGLEGVVDFSPQISQGGVFRPMQDHEFFAQVQLAPGGSYISWPGELEFCADSLRQDVEAGLKQYA